MGNGTKGKRGHKLLTKELEKLLPAIYATDGKPETERKVPVKFFSPYSRFTWYCLENSPEDRLFFGLVKGQETEFGYFTLDELDQVEVSLGGTKVPAVERDCYWNPDTTLAQVQSGERS